MKYSSDRKVCFEEKDHSYYEVETGQKLLSVTSMISHFKQPFNAEEVALRLSLKGGNTVEEILQEWEHKRNKACELGTYLHNGLEDAFNGKPRELNFEKYAKAQIVNKFIREIVLTKKIKPVLVEPIAYDLERGLAGQVDLVGDTSKGRFIFDYKTNEEIKRKNFFQRMKKPFEYLDDCNFNHYALQLNIYRELLKNQGVKVDGMYLIHFDFFEFKFLKIKEIDVKGKLK